MSVVSKRLLLRQSTDSTKTKPWISGQMFLKQYGPQMRSGASARAHQVRALGS